MSESRRAASYLRVSTSDQASRDLSVPGQRRAIANYAKAHNLQLVQEYVDAGESARTTARPKFQEMLTDSRSKPAPFELVVVYDFSRFSRDATDAAVTKRDLRRRGVDV